MTERRERRRKELMDDPKEKIDYCKLEEEVLDCTLWKILFGRGYGSVARQTME
jgi:hypothetical protein